MIKVLNILNYNLSEDYVNKLNNIINEDYSITHLKDINHKLYDKISDFCVYREHFSDTKEFKNTVEKLIDISNNFDYCIIFNNLSLILHILQLSDFNIFRCEYLVPCFNQHIIEEKQQPDGSILQKSIIKHRYWITI